MEEVLLLAPCVITHLRYERVISSINRLYFFPENQIIGYKTVFTVKDKDSLSHLDCTSETQIMVGEDALRSARFRQITATYIPLSKGQSTKRVCILSIGVVCPFLSKVL